MHRLLLFGLVPLLAAVAAAWLIVLDRQGLLVWDHWDESKRGVLYRSGQLTSAQLTEATGRYGIRTVINLQMPGEELEEERELTKRLGVDFVNLPMPGDGFGEEDGEFREILKVIDDPERQTGCSSIAPRGTCRTGAAVAMYRFRTRRLDDRRRRGRDRGDKPHIAMAGFPGTSTRCPSEEQAGVGAAPQPEMLYERNRPETAPTDCGGRPGLSGIRRSDGARSTRP